MVFRFQFCQQPMLGKWTDLSEFPKRVTRRSRSRWSQVHSIVKSTFFKESTDSFFTLHVYMLSPLWHGESKFRISFDLPRSTFGTTRRLLWQYLRQVSEATMDFCCHTLHVILGFAVIQSYRYFSAQFPIHLDFFKMLVGSQLILNCIPFVFPSKPPSSKLT